MSEGKIIVIAVILIIIIYFLFFYKSKPQRAYLPESFINAPDGINDINDIDYPPVENIDNLLIDKMVCHPSCCGNDQWPNPFDGLTANEIKQSIASRIAGGPFVSTNYTCANGPNGVGCPCVTPDAYLNLANRSQSLESLADIEPTLRTGGNAIEYDFTLPPDGKFITDCF